jgi:peptide/nickel transport system permease protein
MSASVTLAAAPPSVWRLFARNRAALAGAVILVLLLAFALFGPLLLPHGPEDVSAGSSMAPPDAAFPFGTDDLGRDVLSRCASGLRISLTVGVSAAAIATAIGVLVGGIAGFAGGRTDSALMRVTEVFQVIPRFFLAVLLVAFFGAGIGMIIIAIAVLAWPDVARLLRSEVLVLRGRQFIDAARLSGAPPVRLIFSEILPNAMGPVIVNTTLLVGQAMLLEAGLAYLGLGDPSVVSLGVMLQQAQQIMQAAWWTSVFPGVLLFLSVLALNVMGDGLNEAVNPRARGR